MQKRLNRLSLGSVMIIVLFVGTFAFGMNQPTTAQDPIFATQFTDIYNRVSPSVVAIGSISRSGQSEGSGFVIDQTGHIITNNHVVANSIALEVEFFDGTLARAEIVGVDADSDIAVIRVNISPEKLVPVQFANSDALQVGEVAIAIGSPFSQRWTLTTGIISALDRTIQGLSNFRVGGVIQTDASINPGNSGGPLLNIQGNVIGVNTQILSNTRTSSGVGFAIPGNLVQRVAQQIIQNGFVEYSYIGITGGDVTIAMQEALELQNDLRGVVIGEAIFGGPAARAGLRSAGDAIQFNGSVVPTSVDIITAINGTPLKGMNDLITYLATNTSPGDIVNLTIIRDGTQQFDVPVELTIRGRL